MTTPEQRKNPRRRGAQGRSARIARRKKFPQVSNIQGHHFGFRKVQASASFTVPADGVIYGYILLKKLIGHATCVIKFEKASNVEIPVRDGKNKYPEISVEGGDTLKVYVKPVEEDATVEEISIGILFKETV
ncbi:hypothetical protein LCGC14_1967540 [marine sediment metagenome]|uniref:Uncharacterized protein n=1 Tax=marine sediment metagenome TaxID=412755 RepID=A0A0F9FCP8_9ZZZZ